MTQPIHIMLDLETWGKRPGCDLRSIGACVFNPDTGFVHDGSLGTIKPFYQAVDNPTPPALAHAMTVPNVEPCFIDGVQWHWDGVSAYRKYPLHRDPETVKWWNDQSAEAQAAFADPVDLRHGLQQFAIWLYTLAPFTVRDGRTWHSTDIRLWAHGPQFDCSILAAAFDAVNLPVPWHYRTPRDTRTIFDAVGIDDSGDGSYRDFMTPFNHGTAHHALHDAIAQARCVCEAWNRLQGRDLV